MDENSNVSFISRKQRQKNMDDILNSLHPEKTNFNTMILGFADIMQSSFYNYMMSLCQTQQERDALNNRVNKCVNAVMDVLNEHSLSNPEDMIVLNTVMIEAINKALYRQEGSGEVEVSQSISTR
jgi:DNA-binding protein YbaB